jgi:hypothetical protein
MLIGSINTKNSSFSSTSSSSNDSIKPILVHDHSSHHHQQQHVHVQDDPEHQSNDQALTPEEQGLIEYQRKLISFICFREKKTIRIKAKETLQ